MSDRSDDSGRPAPSRPEQVLAAYGGKPERWPLAERAAIFAAVADPRLAQVRAREAALDQLLDTVPAYVPAPPLAAGLRAQARLSGWRAAWAALLGEVPAPLLLRPASAFAVAMMLGLIAGAVWTPADNPDAVAAEFVSLAFAHDFQEAVNGSAQE